MVACLRCNYDVRFLDYWQPWRMDPYCQSVVLPKSVALVFPKLDQRYEAYGGLDYLAQAELV